MDVSEIYMKVLDVWILRVPILNLRYSWASLGTVSIAYTLETLSSIVSMELIRVFCRRSELKEIAVLIEQSSGISDW